MHVRTVLPVSERRACRVLAQPRSTQRRPARVAADAPALIARRSTRARRFGRSGSRRSTALLRAEGWRVTHKRVERLWRQEGLRVPRKPRRRRRLGATDGSCTRRRAARPHPVWSDACVRKRTHDGRPLRVRTIVDEHARACLSIDVARRLRSDAARSAYTRPNAYPAPVSRNGASRPHRVGRDASNIAEAVIAYLTGLDGAEVTVTLEIDARLADEASEHTRRTVTENGRELSFEAGSGFETE